jgi:hypothetical protein
VLIVALGFVLGSVPARNSDLWLHLAAGRQLAKGDGPLGADPFAYTTRGTEWVNHAWLFDLLVYLLYGAAGGAGLVLAKAVLVSLLAAVVLRLGATGPRLAVAALGALGTVLALGPWLQLQPSCVSYLFLALTVWLLERRREEGRAPSVWGYWPLWLLFALWVNLDGWFLLGPATVALYGLGDLFPALFSLEMRPDVRVRTRVLGIVAVVGLGACLFNPWHAHALTLPVGLGLGDAAVVLREDAVGRGLVISPLAGRFLRSSQAWNAGGASYVLLALLGAASFALNRQRSSGPRCLLWLALLLLSLYQARTIPFFAVVAGPFLALNVQEALQESTGSGTRQSSRRGVALGRAALLLLGLGLLVAAWPGWLQPRPSQPRGWAVHPDASLVRAARQLGRWRQEGKLGSRSRGFNFTPEVAHYFAWFCPEEKGFLDRRLGLFSRRSALDYRTVRQALLAPSDAGAVQADWRAVLRAHQVDHLILHDGNWQNLTLAFRHLIHSGAEWDLLWQEGSTAIFGWRDGDPHRFRHLRYDPAREAYRSAGPPHARRSRDREEAALHLIHFEALLPRSLARIQRLWVESLSAGTVAGGGAPNGWLPICTDLGLRLHLAFPTWSGGKLPDGRTPEGQEPARGPAVKRVQPSALSARLWDGFLARRDSAPPSLLLLAVRAARRAIQADPRDAAAHLLLGEAYLRLARSTRERGWAAQLPAWHQVRRGQAIAALQRGLRLDPMLAPAHAHLAQLYAESGHLDLVLEHLRGQLRATRPTAGESAAAFAERTAPLREKIERLRRRIETATAAFEVNAENLKTYDRARLAFRAGLARKALDTLLASDTADFGAAGVRLEVNLLLLCGRADSVREWLNPEHRPAFGDVDYHWMLAQAAAAAGDYAGADENLAEMARRGKAVRARGGLVLDARGGIGLAATQAVLEHRLPLGGPALLAPAVLNRLLFLGRLGILVEYLRQQGDILVLRGLLSLEAGQVEQAKRDWRKARALWASEAAVNRGAGVDFGGRVIAQYGLDLLATRH